MKRIITVLLVFLFGISIVVGGYLGYVILSYNRIADQLKIETSNPQEKELELEETYTLLTYNIGFGAYEPMYSFFMDTGVMKEGTKTQGKYGKATSYESVVNNVEGIVEVSTSTKYDFYFFQEVDQKADRSYHINQVDVLETIFNNYGSAFALNFHSAYLWYPLLDPHGKTDAGLLSLSSYKIEDNTRVSLPITTDWFAKYLELDRALLVTRIPVGDVSLVLINAHFSAYDEGGTSRKEQLALLMKMMKEEIDVGNYVIVGGDFNQILQHDPTLFESEQEVPGWISMLRKEELIDEIFYVHPSNEQEVASIRSTDIAFTKGVNYEAIVDGFIVSNNVEATSRIIDTEYQYSDHNPVMLEFILKK